MKEFLEKNLNQKIKLDKTDQLYASLPLQYKGRYDFYVAEAGTVRWLIAEPKDRTALTDLRKDWRRITQVSEMECVLFLKESNAYAVSTMMSEGIFFIIDKKQIYMPRLGIMLTAAENRMVRPVQQISFLTQKMILTAIYEKWTGVNVTAAAEKLAVSKMSATRCFDEMEYIGIDMLEKTQSRRKITVKKTAKETWEEVEKYLISPVIKEFRLTTDAGLPVKSGISALAELTLVSDNPYPTYGIQKKDLKQSGILSARPCGWDEEIECIVQELGYFIDFCGKKIMDPLSIVLALSEEEKSDGRIRNSVEEMLEEYVW